MIRPYAMGGDWQLRALDADQRGHLGSPGRRGQSSPRRLDATDRRVITALFRDGRASLTEIAAHLDCSVSTARRRLNVLLERSALLLRCDVAQPLSGWPVSVWMWAHVPVDECDDVARRLVALPETRACLVLTGAPANFFYSVWVRSLEDVHRVEQLLRQIVPSLEILDRTVTLRFFKRMGRILDESGRSTESVPMDIWSDPVEAE
ncbi:Lrp/AsnC family transcriptional regulator [Prescottella defluvii]|nr:Lrp/AsnC family transcriptional regulator [Prescottella defluvii]